MKLRLIIFRALSLLLGLIIALLVVEIALRLKRGNPQDSENLAPGLIRPDPDLGWVLTPDWSGRHTHADFDVRYLINSTGFRADAEVPERREGLLYAFVGDSFTFGLGVEDTQTFVAELNRSGTNSHLNCGVPGYSTDQEALLIERDVLRLTPSVVVVVAYLGNDLFDNMLSVPLQVNLAKPRFEPRGQELVLLGPVNLAQAEPPLGATLSGVVLGESYCRSWRGQLGRRSMLFQSVSERLLARGELSAGFEARFRPALTLFKSIVKRMRKDCEDQGVEMILALLPGRSFVEEPGSISAKYQEFLRAQLVAEPSGAGARVIDLAGRMRQEHPLQGERWFYPNDGHLTAEGHRQVARLLHEEL